MGEIDFSLVHDAAPDVGIKLIAVHELICTYTPDARIANDSSRSFGISIQANPNDHVSIVVESMDNVIVSARNPIRMVYDIKYLGDGLFSS